jgi:hypothetical protein
MLQSMVQLAFDAHVLALSANEIRLRRQAAFDPKRTMALAAVIDLCYVLDYPVSKYPYQLVREKSAMSSRSLFPHFFDQCY